MAIVQPPAAMRPRQTGPDGLRREEMLATMSKNNYRGLDINERPRGYNVYRDGVMQFMGLTEADARMTVEKINATPEHEQMAVMRALHAEFAERY